ncbi:hypothetical protein CLIB1444_02S10572 [[Candida] jaroonii]|uniref:Uncharacterized protein n=1 Tax=[Candida] jaroonii TaxID=467808 RepID=A0ACA9Y3I7_9ASCO|nr:hypothetical protein CLIB1444_02S10572 [[Candida] jaroonii]
MGNCDVKIEIDKTATDGVFTNHDLISGTVTLTVTNTISLNYIQVKLEGISKTELTIPRDVSKREKRDKVLQDIHKVLYDTLIVFPPENIRKVSNAKEFTLTPGNYTYPFQFKIPLNNSCTKLSGITNKVSFNKKNINVSINNGNFNRNMLKNMASQYINNKSSEKPPNNGGIPYHITNQLPPSLSGLGDFASVKYFVKVTCKRSSFLKVNLRSFDTFIFLPIDLDSSNKPLFNSGDFVEYKEIFVRKDVIFKNRIPEIVGMKVEKETKNLPPIPYNYQKKGFFAKFFDTSPSSTPSPSRKSSSASLPVPVPVSEVPFSFEVRFRYPSFLIPTKPPTFKLYLVSSLNPSIYSLAEYGKPEDSNGLGIVYLQRLIIELTATTIISVLENDGISSEIHKSRHDEVISLANNTYQNLKFDLINCKRTKSSSSTSNTKVKSNIYELEIPKKYFTNCVLPDHVSPSFKTCNIQRKYKLSIIGGFSSEKIQDFNNQTEINKKVRFVDLQVNDINILSGLGMTSALNSNLQPPPPLPIRKSSNSNASQLTPPSIPTSNSDSNHSSNDSLPLPTYEDVIKESSFQNDSDHIRARRRYQQHQQYYENLE